MRHCLIALAVYVSIHFNTELFEANNFHNRFFFIGYGRLPTFRIVCQLFGSISVAHMASLCIICIHGYIGH